VVLMAYACVKNSDQWFHSCCWIRSRGHSLSTDWNGGVQVNPQT
jgi:hypothetical protein